jgi:hypothetical protein
MGSVVLAVVALVAAGCGGLGLDPSGHLACSPPPQNACPKGFSCNAGRCWRNGSLDAPIEASGSEVRSDTANMDEAQETPDGSPPDVAPPDVGPAEVSPGDVSTTDLSGTEVATCSKTCPAPASNGHATCAGDTCGIACDSGYHKCFNAMGCLANGGTTCCSYEDCLPATPACVAGQCKPRALNDACQGDSECGSGHCQQVKIGDASNKVCCDSVCTGTCNQGCAGGTCQHQLFRTSCGEIDNAYYGPRYFLCDGNGNCNPPAFPCGGGTGCGARTDVACCGDPLNNLTPACIAPSMCGQGGGNFEQSCQATIDCPVGTFCCVLENPDLQITACAANCQTWAPAGFDPTAYAHSQACDYVRDSSCPNGQKCGSAGSFGISKCGP